MEPLNNDELQNKKVRFANSVKNDNAQKKKMALSKGNAGSFS